MIGFFISLMKPMSGDMDEFMEDMVKVKKISQGYMIDAARSGDHER